MIPVPRLPCPDILIRKEAEWTAELCRKRVEYYRKLRRHQTNPRIKKPERPEANKAHYAHKQVKAQLSAMFQGKCAYCESRVEESSHLHVEHFRPQSIYPRLAYHWNNMLDACERCNSDHKKARFPLFGGIEPIEDENDPCRLSDTDANMLVNPCEEDPAQFFTFSEERIVCKNDRAEITRDVCQLDREGLNDARRMLLPWAEDAVKLYKLALLRSDQHEIVKCADRLKTLTSAKFPYSSMLRTKIASMGIDVNNL